MNERVNQPIRLRTDRPTKPGYHFLGWSLEPDSQRVDYAPGETVVIGGGGPTFDGPSSLNLYAVFGQPLSAAQGVSLPGKTPAELQERFGGAVQYTPGTEVFPPTITLTNADITAEVLLAARNAVGLYANSDLNIRLVGTNIIRVNPFEKGIQCDGRLSFSGNGSLYIFVPDETRISDGICAGSMADLPDTVYVGPETDIPEPEGVTVSGQVESYNPGNATTIQLMQGGKEQYKTTIAADTGSGQKEQNFSFPAVAAGTYDLVVTKPGHLTYTITGVVVGSENLDLTKNANASISTITLLCGDIDGDGKINNLDYAIVMNPANFNKSYTIPGDVGNVLADLNGDSKINNLDYALILNPNHFNKNTSHCSTNYVV